MLAYQNEPYVERAIRSVLTQRCEFEFELLIGEDSSTDGTLAAIRRALEADQKNVRVFARDRNLGMHRNYDELLRTCVGTFVANIDGDDEWVDPEKLSKQLLAFQRDRDVSMVFGRSEAVDKKGEILSAADYTRPRSSASLNELFVKCDIPHSTIMFRRDLLPSLPAWVLSLPNYDWAIFLILASQGGVVGLPDVLARYTWHMQGAASGRSNRQHFFANAQQYVALADRFQSELSFTALCEARKRLEDCLSWALLDGGSWYDHASMAITYLKTCNKLSVAPSYRWLAGESLSHAERFTDSLWRAAKARR